LVGYLTAGATPVWRLGSFAVLSLLYRAEVSADHRPAWDQLISTWAALKGADAGDLQQPGRHRADQGGELSLELVGLDLEGPDALGGGPQRPHGGLVLQRPGWPWPQAGAIVDLAGGVTAAELGSQLLGSADDQGLSWPTAATRAWVAQRRVVSSTRRASRWPRRRGMARRS
jgi:hypothetical protein